MDSDTWSPKASEHLIEAYKVVWKSLEEAPEVAATSEIKKREVLQEQIAVATGAYNSLQSLKGGRFPGDLDSERVNKLFQSLQTYERQFQVFLASNVLGNELTNEAKSLQSIKLPGISAGSRPTILEKQRVKAQKLPSKGEDPNL
jgi:hypothetical protein